MSDSIKPTKASFCCKYCQKNIQIPYGLSVITAPCPYCGKEVTSPDFDKEEAAAPKSSESKPSETIKIDEASKANEANKIEPVQASTGSAVKAPVLVTSAAVPIKKTSDLASANKEASEKLGEDEEVSEKSKEARLIWIVLLVLLLVIGGLAIWLTSSGGNQAAVAQAQADEDAGPSAEELKKEWRAGGWKQDASNVLIGFMSAKSAEEKMKYVIANDGVQEGLQQFYPAGSDDSDTPAEFFAHRSGSEQDHERGIFRMQYRQPGQVEIKDYFAPIGSLDKIMGMKEATLIDMAYAINKSNVSVPISIMAFFKDTEAGLKLDASVFMQGKFRTFRSFVNYPKPGGKEIFRVTISESIDHELRDNKQYRTYRIEDFAYPEEHVNVSVKVDSEVGKILSALNWRGTDRDYQARTATIELGWSKAKPVSLQVERLICWEFLGVGGEIGNTAVDADSDEVTKVPQTSDK